ncbi:hypothetical protein DH2020_043945 [Rehmannia glutinosa]|uniref:Uncharacterized protein n=1 Tax=Rehmannia glutinosa TaxID=99300 RepID=A0ABR0UK40_REHGL
MASSSFSFCRLRNTPYFSRFKVQLPPQARSQNFRDDQGNSSNTVDANMSVLRYRMEQLRMRDRLNSCHNLSNGWNYRSGNDDVRNKHNMLLMIFELASTIGSTIGLVFLSGSLCIFLVALISHHGPLS